MIPNGFDILPGVGGGLFVDTRSTAAGLNKPRWARITGSAGKNPTRYAWTEQTFQRLGPGNTDALGPTNMEGGMYGTTDFNPIIDPNGAVLTVGTYLLVQSTYLDPIYDWVFAPVGGKGATDTSGFWARLNGPPSLGVVGGNSGSLAANTYYLRATLVFPYGEFSATQIASVQTTGSNGSIAVTAPSSVSGATGWNLYMDTIDSTKGNLQNSTPYSFSTNPTTTSYTSGVAGPAQSYSWIQETPAALGTFKDTDGGLSGTFSFNPAYDINNGFYDFLTQPVYTWMRLGFDSGSAAHGQEYLFDGGTSQSINQYVSIACSGGALTTTLKAFNYTLGRLVSTQ